MSAHQDILDAISAKVATAASIDAADVLQRPVAVQDVGVPGARVLVVDYSANPIEFRQVEMEYLVEVVVVKKFAVAGVEGEPAARADMAAILESAQAAFVADPTLGGVARHAEVTDLPVSSDPSNGLALGGLTIVAEVLV